MHSYGWNKIKISRGENMNYTLHTTAYFEMVVVPSLKLEILRMVKRAVFHTAFPHEPSILSSAFIPQHRQLLVTSLTRTMAASCRKKHDLVEKTKCFTC